MSFAREGKLHDKRFHDEDDIAGSVPDAIPIEVDLGFQGLHKQYENIHLPHKKPRGGELNDVQKQENRCLSQSRVLCKLTPLSQRRGIRLSPPDGMFQ